MSLYDKSIGKEARASLEFAEDSRETEWLHPSYSAMLYQGEVKWDLLHPFPRQTAEEQKIGAEFRPYRILGACNPALAHKALSAEDKIGTMLPCNVIVQDLGGGRIEVAAINPLVAMEKVGNPALATGSVRLSGEVEKCGRGNLTSWAAGGAGTIKLEPRELPLAASNTAVTHPFGSGLDVLTKSCPLRFPGAWRSGSRAGSSGVR